MNNKIFYLCDSIQTPYGGIKKIYQHVDFLNEMGYSAFVLHEKQNFRCRWFPNKTPIVYSSFQRSLDPISQDDILVIPENVFYKIGPQAVQRNIPVVIFNQNPYNTFTPSPKDKSRIFSAKRTLERDKDTPYKYKKLLGSMVVSNDSIEYLNFAFPHMVVHRIRLSISTEQFSYNAAKKMQIAVYTGKCHEHVRQVVYILQERGNLISNSDCKGKC